MMHRTLLLLAATAMSMLLAGCGGTPQDASSSRDGSNSQQQSAGADTTSAGDCADSGCTDSTRVDSGEASNGKIVFARRIADGTDIYVIDEDGTHETRLTRTEPFEEFPGWSPDGQKIAFARNSTELYVINADGSGLKHLGGATYEGAALAPPVWSPDGQNIAFLTVGTSSEHYYDALYVINADGTKQTQLIKSSANSEYEISLGGPTWLPTGNKIAFSRFTLPPTDSSAESVSAAEDESGLYLINADGTGLRKLISIRAQATPYWSPDGEKIAIYDNGAINVLNTDGSGRKQLTGDTYDPADLAWSPDGQRIAFVNSSADLYVINADGSGRRRLANAVGDSTSPTWSPAGERIAFFCPQGPGASTTDTAVSDLCVINADGTEWTRLVLEVDAAVNNPFALWGSG
jgi:Tol biopolymer transport system component